MRVCLYNSFSFKKEGDFDKSIWCPLSMDILHIVHFFQQYHGENIIHLESVFKPYIVDDSSFENQDIIYFETEKQESPRSDRLVAFYSQRDTLANNTLCLISGNPGFSFINFVPSYRTENSDLFLKTQNIPFLKYSYRHLRNLRPDILVMYNDWTKASIRIIAQCHILKIPVVCIQESIIDFGDSFRRMQHADNVIIQGPKTAIELNRKEFFLTGNPRYSLPSQRNRSADYVLINCNFTYNIFEDIRYEWLDDITSVLDDLGINYLISQHPRDSGNLDRYKNHIKSSSSSLKEQLRNAGLVITRFSSMIHESLIEGVPVIYYNPHNEQMQYDFEFNSDFLIQLKDKSSLREASKALYNKNISGKGLDYYLNSHCLPVKTNSVANINSLLSKYIFTSGSFSYYDFLHLIIYQSFIIRSVQFIRQILSGHFKFKD